ncbi:MAG: tetratricopeptide repeat protein [Puniceicoccales bacterium]|jgi:Ca-activated chloride channel family protein|nr:tetratricopeptide repeat protein [Puniceicoccales bacterium]
MKIECLLLFTFYSFTSFLRGEVNTLTAAKARHQKYCEQHPDVWQGHYNLANVHYKEEAFNEAQTSYEQALEKCTLPQDQESIFYNLGNTYYRQFQQTQDAKQQMASLEKSIKFFESALALNPKAADAQHNLEIAKKALEKLKKNQEQQKQEQPQDNSNNTSNDSNADNESSSKENEKEKEKETEKESEDKAPDKPQANRMNENAPQQAPMPQQERSQQEMETLLKSTKGDEKVLPINFSSDSQNLPEDPRVLQDW